MEFLTCQWAGCGKAFPRPGHKGRPPRFCSPSCRAKAGQKAGAERRASARAAGFSADSGSCVSDGDYTPDEHEFMRAVDKYKRERRRPFPKLTELLAVLKELGYRKEGA